MRIYMSMFSTKAVHGYGWDMYIEYVSIKN